MMKKMMKKVAMFLVVVTMMAAVNPVATSAASEDVIACGHYFTDHVGQYNAVVGEKYYILDDDGSRWFYGELVNSFEKDRIFGTKRVHRFNVLSENGKACVPEWRFFDGSDFTLYKTMKDVEGFHMTKVYEF